MSANVTEIMSIDPKAVFKNFVNKTISKKDKNPDAPALKGSKKKLDAM